MIWDTVPPAQPLVRSANPARRCWMPFCATLPLYYNTNPLSSTLPETQTPRNQPIIGTQPPATSLTSRLALSIILI